MQKVQDRLSDQEKEDLIAGHYKSILELLGEDVNREGLEKTPIRVARAMKFLTSGYDQSPEEILRSAIFHENYGEFSANSSCKRYRVLFFCVNITCFLSSVKYISDICREIRSWV